MRSWLLISGLLLSSGQLFAREPVDFNRDVRPILSEHCWRCHGFDEGSRESGLRLDLRQTAIAPADSGVSAIVPGDPLHSELMSRISTADNSLRMPPADAHGPLTEKQVATLRQWIEEGAVYRRHWAFEPIMQPSVPVEPSVDHPIDTFVLSTLKRKGMEFTEAASSETLLRRLFLDLTGLPPTLSDLEEARASSYEQTVDRLLASPHFGERMAVNWLDAARYADTNGYFGDRPREIWPWRDWVINAFNSNMPFDQFTIEQLAGDLLPQATLQQIVATGFNRNHMSNNETGIIEEEYRVEYVIDRLDTTATTWMGLTLGCAQCHDHKYDPVTQREFYQFFAFFNNIEERGLLLGDNPAPFISVPTPEQSRRSMELAAEAKTARNRFAPIQKELQDQLQKWEPQAERTLPPAPQQHVIFQESFEENVGDAARMLGTTFTFERGVQGKSAAFDGTRHVEAKISSFNPDAPWTLGVWMLPQGPLSCIASQVEPAPDRRGWEVLWHRGQLQIYLTHQWGTDGLFVKTIDPVSSKSWHHLVISYDGSRRANGIQVLIDGQLARTDVQLDSLSGSIAPDAPLRLGRRDAGLGFYGNLDEVRLLSEAMSAPRVKDWFTAERLGGVLKRTPEERHATEKEALFGHFVEQFSTPQQREAYKQVQRTQAAETSFATTIPKTLVMKERSEPRETHLLNRGQYDAPGELVSAGVPAALSPFPSDAPANRLGLARWLMAEENPLTARVIVNRLWSQCFGAGLVRTVNDFGTQGEPPTHPELLDFLASRFRESGWNVKELLRLIVTSRTYRQSSRMQMIDGEVVDPENRWLSRGPGFRLSQEMLRDQALTVSGLLAPQIGGPSVKPYQPPGLWEETSYNGEETYVVDTGAAQWRRSLYTYVKRQAPPPAMLIFDGPTREKCTVSRGTTNTPLQALVTLNDPTFAEAAKALAIQVIQAKQTDDQRLNRLWRTVLTRDATDFEMERLISLLQRQRERFQISPASADQFLSAGNVPSPDDCSHSELASWTFVALTLFNLDEAIMRY